MTRKKPTKRRQARQRALEVLYGLCFVTADTVAELEALYMRMPVPTAAQKKETAEKKKAATNKLPAEPQQPERPQGPTTQDFSWTLVQGVWQHRTALDEHITRFSQHWKLSRIARVELSVLRIALFELFYLDDIPPRVTINEALELMKRYGDETSKNFINGILDAAAKTLTYD